MKPKCLALPNFQTYYWATNTRNMLFWVQHDIQLQKFQWVLMKAASCSTTTLTSLLCAPIPFKYTTLVKNLVVKHSLRIWSQFFLTLGLKNHSLSTMLQEEELNLVLEENVWDSILARIHSSSINASILFQFQVVHRTHWSRTKLK